MSKRSEARDNFIHFQLRNWSAYINEGWQDGPRPHANPASWQGKIVNSHDVNFPDPPMVIDHDSAERVQHGMVRCQINDLQTAQLLILHYRDNWQVNNIKRYRNKFWRYL